MKRLSTILLLLAFGLSSCVYDADDSRSDKSGGLSIGDARDFFEENALEFNPAEVILPKGYTRSGELPHVVMTPLWKSASAYNADTVDVVNVPIMLSSMMLVRRSENIDGLPQTGYNLSVDSRLIVEKQDDGSVHMFVLTLMGDYDYLLDHTSSETRYLHPGNNFSGLAIISELDGTLIGISEYKDGVYECDWHVVSDDEIASGEIGYYTSLQYKSPFTAAGEKFVGTRGVDDDNVIPEVVVTAPVVESIWSWTLPYYPALPPVNIAPGGGGGYSGGGGYGGNSPSNPPKPPADSDPEEEDPHLILQSDPDLREAMQNLLDTFMDSKLGNKLMERITELLQGTDNDVYILYTDTRVDGCEETDLGCTFYENDGDVRCYIFEDHLPTLYEELGHALQSKNHPHEISIHREMEVKMMVYDFNTENGITPLGDPKDWDIINDYSYGRVSAGKAKRALRRLGYDTSDFDPDTFHIDNLNELRN